MTNSMGTSLANNCNEDSDLIVIWGEEVASITLWGSLNGLWKKTIYSEF